jgi:hypothetical protein
MRPAETKYVEYSQNIGAIIMRFHKNVKGYLCKDCTNSYFWSYTGTTLVLGWWGIISFFVTLFVLPSNIFYYLGTLGLNSPKAIEQNKLQEGEMKKCPYCAEPIKVDARVCRYCGKDLSGTLQSDVNVNIRKLDWDTIIGILESVCPLKGTDWVKWGESIIRTIRSNTNQIVYPEKQVSIDFSTNNWTAINSIIQENSKTRGGDWVAWAESVSICAVYRK